MKSISLKDLYKYVKDENTINGGNFNKLPSYIVENLKSDLLYNRYSRFGIFHTSKISYNLYLESIISIFGKKLIYRLLDENETIYKKEVAKHNHILFNNRVMYGPY